jgi:hypothetical protein
VKVLVLQLVLLAVASAYIGIVQIRARRTAQRERSRLNETNGGTN